MLPGVDPADEDAFIRKWMDSSDLDGLVSAISDAVEARRPQLAARLVGLLDDSFEIEPGSPLARAQRAAQFLLLQPQSQAKEIAFEDAWIEAKRHRIRKIKKRMRNRLMGRPPRKR